MKNIYSILSLFLLLFSISVFGQSKIYAPTLRAPLDTEVDQMPDAILDWDAVTGITLEITYEAQIANNPDFTDAVTFPRTDITAETMSDLLFGNTYYWRVKAYDAGESSDWSDVWSFTVIEKFTFNISPASGRLVYATQNIPWDEVTGIDKYQLQVDTAYTWQIMHTVTKKAINGLFVFPDGKKWIAGAEGLLMHFDGSNWMSYDLADTDIEFNDIFFVNESSGYAVGKEGVVYHFDGNTWNAIDIGVNDDFDCNGVSFADENSGWVVGSGGDIIKYSNGSWSEETSVSTDLYSIYTINDANVWACGKSKKVAHYDGVEWTDETVGTKDLNDIYFVGEDNGWVVGKSGAIFHYDGNGWNEQESNTTEDLFGVSFAGETGIAVGKEGAFLSYEGGTWNVESSGVELNLMTVDVQSAQDIFAMGEFGVMITNGSDEFVSPFAYIINISPDSNEYTFNSLLFGQPYYYRLRGMHGVDTSTWSNVKSIRTYSKPALESPETGISDTDLLLKFAWFEYKGVTNYIYEVDTVENFTQPRVFTPDDDTITVNDFVFGQEYFWRVAAQHINDISDWSDTWTFSTINTITLTNPEDQEKDVSACPLYTWVEILGASQYELWLDTDESFSNHISINSDAAFYQCQSSIERNTVYYWKVRGLSGAVYSDWSEVWEFKTEGYIGIDEQFNENSVVIFPNPGNGEFTLNITSLTNDSYSLQVIDITGRVIYLNEVECQIGINNISVTLDNLNKGAYSLIIKNAEQVVTKKLLVQ